LIREFRLHSRESSESARPAIRSIPARCYLTLMEINREAPHIGGTEERSLVIFDGDDTLWRTQELYDLAKLRFASLLSKEGLTNPDPITTLDRIDAEAVEVRAFTIDRFIDSMVTTYHVLNRAANRQVNESTERKIRRLNGLLLGGYKLYPDARDVLRQLAPAFRLVLATKGEPELQGRKIARSEVGQFFDQIYVMERKTEEEYRMILGAYQMPPNRAWAVGNSVRSDINPALLLGIRAILIKRPTWRYEETKLRSGDLTVVDSLSAACNAILQDESRVAASASR
jgi:putative hydrolase of the HAD superfamily